MEQWTQATLVARLKQEQGNFRRTLTRIRTFRETSFVASGHLLANLITNLTMRWARLAEDRTVLRVVASATVIAHLD